MNVLHLLAGGIGRGYDRLRRSVSRRRRGLSPDEARVLWLDAVADAYENREEGASNG